MVLKGQILPQASQGWANKMWDPNLANFDPALAYCFSLNLLEKFSQPGAHLFLAQLCIFQGYEIRKEQMFGEGVPGARTARGHGRRRVCNTQQQHMLSK